LSFVIKHIMSTTRKIVIGLGLAGGALLAAYLLTGDRKKKTKDFLTKTGQKLKDALDPKEKPASNDQDFDYV
jgi:multisubunit Na+/H+ antiporter MnhC subunit